MPLFGDIKRYELRARRQNESGFDYMNTSAPPGIGAIRVLLEQWFEHLPANGQPDIRGRFRSQDPAQHESAFFELYWHELLRCCGATVEIHPALPNVVTNPDMLCNFIWRQRSRCHRGTPPRIAGLQNCRTHSTEWIPQIISWRSNIEDFRREPLEAVLFAKGWNAGSDS